MNIYVLFIQIWYSYVCNALYMYNEIHALFHIRYMYRGTHLYIYAIQTNWWWPSCMCVYVFYACGVCIFVCVGASVGVGVRVFLFMCVCACTCACARACVCVCMYVCLRACISNLDNHILHLNAWHNGVIHQHCQVFYSTVSHYQTNAKTNTYNTRMCAENNKQLTMICLSI